MRLPNAESAIVDDRKLREYLLSPSHPIGHFKAAFLGHLGFTAGDWIELRDQLLELAITEDVDEETDSGFGRKYLIRGILTGPTGRSAEVVSVWIIRIGDDKPRLVTVYPR